MSLANNEADNDTIVPGVEWALTVGDQTATYTVQTNDELKHVVEELVKAWTRTWPDNADYTVTQVSGESKIKVERNNSEVLGEVRFGATDNGNSLYSATVQQNYLEVKRVDGSDSGTPLS